MLHNRGMAGIKPADDVDAVQQRRIQEFLAMMDENCFPVSLKLPHGEHVESAESAWVRCVQIFQQHGRTKEDTMPLCAERKQRAG